MTLAPFGCFPVGTIISHLDSFFRVMVWLAVTNNYNNLNTVKTISNMPATISYNQNARRSVKIQCIKGDLNYDGILNSSDLSLLIEYTLGNYDFSNLQNYLGDYNEDGEINDDDVSSLSFYLLMHTNRNELNKVRKLAQEYTEYMIANNYDKAKISEMQKITTLIKTELEAKDKL